MVLASVGVTIRVPTSIVFDLPGEIAGNSPYPWGELDARIVVVVATDNLVLLGVILDSVFRREAVAARGAIADTEMWGFLRVGDTAVATAIDAVFVHTSVL